jgi:hypothetical protein
MSASISLLEPPDTVSPEQFRDLWSGTTESTSEIRLAMAVLVRAIEDLRRFRGGVDGSEMQRLYRHAHRWVASNDRQWPYSFVNVSDILGISSARVRIRLLDDVPLSSRVGRRDGAGPFRRSMSLNKSRRRPVVGSVAPIVLRA